MKYLLSRITVVVSALLPALAFAQGTPLGAGNRLSKFATNIMNFINEVFIPLLFVIALAFFLYSVFKYFIWNSKESGDREEGRQYLIWSIAALVIMLSVMGIVKVISDGLGFDDKLKKSDLPKGPASELIEEMPNLG